MTLKIDPITLELTDSSFIPTVIARPEFQQTGVVYGHTPDSWWIVIEPERHPLTVWRTSERGIGAYGRSAQALNAVVFTNAVMPGRRYSPRRKVTRISALMEMAFWCGLGAASGFAGGRSVRSRLLAGALGGGLGYVNAWRRTFTNWVPCGRVHSDANGIEDRRNFDNEAPTHAWFGRFGSDFSSYGMGDGDLPPGVLEGSGGLLWLVRDRKIPSKHKEDPLYNYNVARLFHKKGIVSWSLIPIVPEQYGLNGVILVFGSSQINAESAAHRLRTIGATYAVGMDQRASAMMGAKQKFMVGPPPIHRQSMQTYGFYCP